MTPEEKAKYSNKSYSDSTYTSLDTGKSTKYERPKEQSVKIKVKKQIHDEKDKAPSEDSEETASATEGNSASEVQDLEI